MYEAIIERYGEEAQCRQAMEECAELIQAINKTLRYPTETSRSQLIEEIVDVQIMIQQLREIYNITSKEIFLMRDYKDNRLLKRLWKESYQ